jgi:hypothetical protein
MDIEGIDVSILTVAPITGAPLPSFRVTVKVSVPFFGGFGVKVVTITISDDAAAVELL